MIRSILDYLSGEKTSCYFCGYKGEYVENYLCPDCRLSIKRIDHSRCSICGKQIGRQSEKLDLCTDCEKVRRYFSKGIAPFVYEGEIKRHIYDFKYNDKPHLKKVFAEYMLEELIGSDMENTDIIIPVPIHISKENTRGYNQSELLSRYISKRLGILHERENLIRTAKNSVQKELSRHQREKNLRGAFKVRDPESIRQKNILLVDDIYTTGATLNENARVLIEAGAKKIDTVTIAISREKRRSPDGSCKL